jgi:hypothetical protein
MALGGLAWIGAVVTTVVTSDKALVLYTGGGVTSLIGFVAPYTSSFDVS